MLLRLSRIGARSNGFIASGYQRRFFAASGNAVTVNLQHGAMVPVPVSSDKSVLLSLTANKTVKELQQEVTAESGANNVRLEIAPRTSLKTPFSGATTLGDILQFGRGKGLQIRLIPESSAEEPSSVNVEVMGSFPVATAAAVPPASATLAAAGAPALSASSTPALDVDPAEIEAARAALPALEARKAELDRKAERGADRLVWAGLGGLVIQWLVLARIVFFDLNWDIMEPVTYFLTTFNLIVFYVYFAVTKQEYTYEAWRKNALVKRQKKLYAQKGFDLEEFQRLQTIAGVPK